MIKNILYIGNNLSRPRTNPSSIQTLGPLLEAEGYVLRYASGYANKGLRLGHMLWTCLRYRRWADVVLIDVYSTLNFYYAVLVGMLCRRLQIPYICCLNGGNLPQRLKRSPRLSHGLFTHSRANVAPSAYLQEAFDRAGYTTQYIPNSIPLHNYPFRKHEHRNIRLLWVRAFAKIYNPTLALKVQWYLKDLGHAVDLCMVGPDADGSLKGVQALAQELGLKVQFTGKLAKAEWIALSEDYNIFINTTDFDNTPVSVIEAMALGLPIVSTNVGGIPYLITDGDEGLLVPAGAVEAMAQAILAYHTDPSLRWRCMALARQKVETFDWKVVKYQWHALFK